MISAISNSSRKALFGKYMKTMNGRYDHRSYEAIH